MGLRARDGSLRTVYAEAGTLRSLGDGVMVPRGEEWWHLRKETRTPGDDADRDEVLVVGPLGAVADTPSPRPVQGCTTRSEVTVHYVGPRWLGLARQQHFTCEGRPPARHDSLMMVPLARPESDLGTSIGAAAGAQVAERFASAGESTRVGTTCLVEPTGDAWTLEHQEGRWMVRGLLAPEDESCGTPARAFTLDAPLPTELSGGGRARLPEHAADLFDGTDLVDAVASPDGELVLGGRRRPPAAPLRGRSQRGDPRRARDDRVGVVGPRARAGGALADAGRRPGRPHGGRGLTAPRTRSGPAGNSVGPTGGSAHPPHPARTRTTHP